MYVIPTLFSSLYLLGAINWYMMHKAVLYLVEVEHNDTHILFKTILYLLEEEHNDVSVLIKSSVWPLLAVNMIIDNLFVHDDEEDEE